MGDAGRPHAGSGLCRERGSGPVRTHSLRPAPQHLPCGGPWGLPPATGQLGAPWLRRGHPQSLRLVWPQQGCDGLGAWDGVSVAGLPGSSPRAVWRVTPGGKGGLVLSTPRGNPSHLTAQLPPGSPAAQPQGAAPSSQQSLGFPWMWLPLGQCCTSGHLILLRAQTQCGN